MSIHVVINRMNKAKVFPFLFVSATAGIVCTALFFSSSNLVTQIHAEESGELVVLSDITIDNVYDIEEDDFGYSFMVSQTTRWGHTFSCDGKASVTGDDVSMKTNGNILEAEGEVTFSFDFNFSKTLRPDKVAFHGSFTDFQGTYTTLTYTALEDSSYINISDYGYSSAI